ncbi:MAG: V-type ATPase subunit [Oscillospiraceae bacterium]|nr:V-type ATPase subunit [Oscillospiraceae bacterium]
MPSQGYQYASGRIAALDSRLPSEQEVRNASSGGLDNLVRLFSQAELLEASARPDSVDTLRNLCETKLRDELSELCPDRRLFDVLWMDGDLINLKLLIKLRLLGLPLDSETLALGTVPAREIVHAVEEKDYSCFDDLQKEILDIDNKVEKDRDIMAACAALDELFIARQKSESEKLGYAPVASFYETKAEYADILTALRCLSLNIPKKTMYSLLIGPNKDRIIGSYDDLPDSLVSVAPLNIREDIQAYLLDRDLSKLSNRIKAVGTGSLSGSFAALEGPAALVAYVSKVRSLLTSISLKKETRS